MTLQQLKYIMEIINKGTINEAAKEFSMSQPSLSNAVKEVEQELKIQIFVRSNKGVTLSSDGEEFMQYAKKVVEQSELLEQRYLKKLPSRKMFAISAQHYTFSVRAFEQFIREFSGEYELSLRETRTQEIIEDVARLRSELGILHLNNFNKKVIGKLLRENGLLFESLFETKPYVIIHKSHHLAARECIRLEELEHSPYISFEQGAQTSCHFTEEVLSTKSHKYSIRVSDKTTMLSLIKEVVGYTLGTGSLEKDQYSKDMVSIPLVSKECVRVGYIYNRKFKLSKLAKNYLNKVRVCIEEYKGESVRKIIS